MSELEKIIRDLITQNTDFVPALAGALIGGLFVLLGTLLTHLIGYINQKWNEKKQLKAFLQGIHTEVTAVWELYDQFVGKRFEELIEKLTEKGEKEQTEPFEFYFLARQNYFTIYEENAELLGKVNNKEIRTKIVTLYTQAKSLIDMWDLYRIMVEKLEQSKQLLDPTHFQDHQKSQESLKGLMIWYLKEMLWKRHCQCKKEMEELLPQLENYIECRKNPKVDRKKEKTQTPTLSS